MTGGAAAAAGNALASELAIAALAMNTDLFFTVSSLCEAGVPRITETFIRESENCLRRK
jgi:hypothetical protein